MSGKVAGRSAVATALADERPKGEDGGSGEEAVATAAPTEQPANGVADEALPAGAAESGDDMKDELPAVEELVKRLRPEVLAALDELFRAKWTSVKRLRPEDLKTG